MPYNNAGGNSGHPQNMGPAQANMASPVPMGSPEELLRLQDENASLRRELDAARSGSVSKEDAVRELQEKLEERNQILTDYERRNEYHESVVTGLKEMIDKLKEQLDHQKEQYSECRKDLVNAQDEAESLKMELTTLKETLESKGMATSNAETAIAELKVQLSQKNRQVSDLQRELDLTQFSCKEERENVERLKENVDTLNEALEESQRHNRDMKKVVEQHEMVFNELKSNLDDRAREIRTLQDSLRSKGGADATALMQQLSQVKDQLNRKNSECEMLQKQLRTAEESANAGAASDAEVKQLRAKVEELEKSITARTNEYQSQCSALQDQIAALKDEKAALEANAGNAGSGLGDTALLDGLRNLYQEINDVVSQWREDLGSLENSISDLQRVFVAYVKIDVNKLTGHDKTRLEAVLKDYDPKLIFEDIGNSLDASQNSLAEIKDKLRALRGMLQM